MKKWVLDCFSNKRASTFPTSSISCEYDATLRKIFPAFVIDDIKVGRKPPVRHHEVCICFMDIVGYTKMVENVDPALVFEYLNAIFEIVDKYVNKYDLYKLETIGDCYVTVGGLYGQRNQERSMLAFAKHVLNDVSQIKYPGDDDDKEYTQVRVGLHSGPVCSGIIGTNNPRFCLVGESMNVAARMEQKSQAYRIRMSKEFKDKLSPDQKDIVNFTQYWEYSSIDIKGKNEHDTYLSGRFASNNGSFADGHDISERRLCAPPSFYNNRVYDDSTD